MHENDFFNEDLLCALAGVAGEDNVLMSEPMREHTTFKIGGPADVFVTPDTEQGLVATLDTCYRCKETIRKNIKCYHIKLNCFLPLIM